MESQTGKGTGNPGMKKTWNRSKPVGLLLILLLLCFGVADGRKPRRIAAGDWGGQHIQMHVENNSATIEYDCARGTISGPLTIDSRGRFTLSGTHTRLHGGPVRADESDKSEAVHYTGWTDGRKMKLTIKSDGTGEDLGTYDLVRGRKGRVVRCL